MFLGKWLRPRFPWQKYNSFHNEETVKRKRKILEDFVISFLVDAHKNTPRSPCGERGAKN